MVCNEKSVQLLTDQSFVQLKEDEYALNSPEIVKDRMVNLKYDIWYFEKWSNSFIDNYMLINFLF